MFYFLYLNYIQLGFLAVTLSVIFFGALVNLFEEQLPSVVVQFVRYGKFGDKKAKSPLIVQVPKSWFRHFYFYSSILLPYALYLCYSNYVYGKNPPHWISTVLDYSMGNSRKPTVNSTRTFLAIFLLTVQCLRRLYDTNFISVFGKNAKIHLGHYVLGFLHYTGCVLTILGGAPNFSTSYPEKSSLRWIDLNMMDLFATYLFLWAWWHQYKVTVILANLRKDHKGNVISDSYKLPKGDWFDAISSPHNFAEIVMYSSLTIMLWPNLTWWFIYIWVIANQVEVALLSHWWYREKFENYPQDRKILFPYMY